MLAPLVFSRRPVTLPRFCSELVLSEAALVKSVPAVLIVGSGAERPSILSPLVSLSRTFHVPSMLPSVLVCADARVSMLLPVMLAHVPPLYGFALLELGRGRPSGA